MPHAVLAGVPPAWARQLKAALNYVERVDWTFSIFQSKETRGIGVAIGQIEQLQREAHQRGGAHVFGVGGRDRGVISDALRRYFRFRWLDAEALRAVPTNHDPFVAELKCAVDEEDAWRAALHPVDKSSPLALPQEGFAAHSGVAHIWEMCEAFNKEAGFFSTVANRIVRFSNCHLKKWDKHSERFFIDEASRVWKDDGPYHGEAPFPRDWKYSSALPAGFHFDVQHEQRKAFEYTDAARVKKAVAAAKHCNVDAHGFLR